MQESESEKSDKKSESDVRRNRKEKVEKFG